MSNNKINDIGQEIGNDDLIFYSLGGNMFSGGFSVDSMLMKGGVSPMKSISVSDSDSHGIFGKNLAVPPMWFLSSHKGSNNRRNNFESREDDDQIGKLLEEDLHDKLLKISQINDRKKRTAKMSQKKINKKTKKRRT